MHRIADVEPERAKDTIIELNNAIGTAEGELEELGEEFRECEGELEILEQDIKELEEEKKDLEYYIIVCSIFF